MLVHGKPVKEKHSSEKKEEKFYLIKLEFGKPFLEGREDIDGMVSRIKYRNCAQNGDDSY